MPKHILFPLIPIRQVDGKVADEIPKSVICGKLSSGTQACQHGGT